MVADLSELSALDRAVLERLLDDPTELEQLTAEFELSIPELSDLLGRSSRRPWFKSYNARRRLAFARGVR
jgi:hypothetical protein